MYSCVHREGVSHLIYMNALILSISMFLAALFVEIYSYLHSSTIYSSETVIFLQRDQCLSPWSKLFYFKSFLRKYNFGCTVYVSVILENHVQCSPGNKVCRACLILLLLLLIRNVIPLVLSQLKLKTCMRLTAEVHESNSPLFSPG